ncbi:hypothetical protein OROGR_029424 [Orobanche gracilis]
MFGFRGDSSKRSRIDSPTDTRIKRVNGIGCIVREDHDVVEYIPYNGVYLKEYSCVAAAGEIPEEMKEEMKRRFRFAVTFSFPSVGVKFGKTDRGALIEVKSFTESHNLAHKYYDEAFRKAVKSLNLPTSFSLIALRSCASGTSSSQPMIKAVESQDFGSSSSALRPCASGTSSSQPMIEVCMNPFVGYR